MTEWQDIYLYGFPDDEVLYRDPETALGDRLYEWEDDDDPQCPVIEVWDVHPPTYHLPHVDSVLEWINEWAAENGELDDDGTDTFDAATRNDAAVKACNDLLDTIAANVEYRIPRHKVREIVVTRRPSDGAWLFDGKPVWGVA